MKRKAILMGMAVMAGMPGWAMAKGGGKAAGGPPVYADGMEARETLGAVEVVNGLPGIGEASPPGTSPGTSAELLAQVRNLLGSANYGAAMKAVDDGMGWTIEFPKHIGETPGYADARFQPGAPVGVAFRLRF